MTRRVAAAGLLLVVLVVFYNLWPRQFGVIGSIGLVVGWAVTLVSAWDLVRLTRAEGLSELAKARLASDAQDAVGLAIGSTGIAVLAFVTLGRALRDFFGISAAWLDTIFPQGSLLVLLLFGLLMMAAPGINWVLYWHRHRGE